MPQKAQQCRGRKPIHSASLSLSLSLFLPAPPSLLLSFSPARRELSLGQFASAGCGSAAVQIIILVPCLIDARYFGLALMTAFTEFMCPLATRPATFPFLSRLSLFLSRVLSLSPSLALLSFSGAHYLARNYLRSLFKPLRSGERPGTYLFPRPPPPTLLR